MKKSTKKLSKQEKIVLDAADRRILTLLQRNNLMTNLELAKAAGLSSPTCLRRVRRLRESGVIVGDVALVDAAKAGHSLTVFVEVVLERQNESGQRAFQAKIHHVPEVTQCYMVSGNSDFLLVARVADMPSYHQFVRRVLIGDENIRNFRSLFAMSQVKFTTAIPLDNGSP